MRRKKINVIAVTPLDPPATEAEKNEASRVWTAAMDVMESRGFGRYLWGNTSEAAHDFVILMLRAARTEVRDIQETSFQRWFAEWQNVFSSECQAREIFKTAQPQAL